MDAALAQLLETVGIETIKVIGPAIVAAIVAYKVASLQFKATLRQLREANEFSARQHLFDYYKERQKRFSEGYSSLINSLSQILGTNTAVSDDELDGSLKAMLDTFSSLAQLYLSATPFEIKLVLRDMKAKKLNELDEYKDLEEKQLNLSGLSLGKDFESKRTAVFFMIEVYGALERCNQLLLEREIDGLFGKYVQERT
jgi:hypothetical protein